MIPPDGSNEPLIKVEKLCKVYRLGNHAGASLNLQVLFDISFTIQRGEFIAIMGHSGSGKSTLMNILGCLDTPTSGYYRLAGHNVSTLSGSRSPVYVTGKSVSCFRGSICSGA